MLIARIENGQVTFEKLQKQQRNEKTILILKQNRLKLRIYIRIIPNVTCSFSIVIFNYYYFFTFRNLLNLKVTNHRNLRL